MSENLFIKGKRYSQEDIGKLLKTTARNVRYLIDRGVLPEGTNKGGLVPLACIHAYITYKSKNSDPEIDPEMGGELVDGRDLEREERILKIEERQESLALKKAKRLLFVKEYGPIAMIEDALQQVGSRLASHHESLIPKMKLAWPDMPPEAVEVLEAVLTAAINECADILPDLSDYFAGGDEDCPEWLIGNQEGEDHTSG